MVHQLQLKSLHVSDYLPITNSSNALEGCIHYHGIGICNQVTQGIQKSLILHHLGIDVMQLGHTDGCGLSYIRVFILQTLAQRLTQILRDLVHPDASHRTDRQSTDERVWVFTVLRGDRICSKQICTAGHWYLLCRQNQAALISNKNHPDYMLKTGSYFRSGIKGGTYSFAETFYTISRWFQATIACKTAISVSLGSPQAKLLSTWSSSWIWSTAKLERQLSPLKTQPQATFRQNKILVSGLSGSREQENIMWKVNK